MFDVVRVVRRDRLIGEIIEMRGDKASIQVYEERRDSAPAISLCPQAPPVCRARAGLIEGMFDGIQRSLRPP